MVAQDSVHRPEPTTPRRNDRLHKAQAARPHSGSPRKHQTKQPLTIRMNLTETQMDRVTDAITQKVDSSPVKSEQTKPFKPAAPQEGDHPAELYESPHDFNDGKGQYKVSFNDVARFREPIPKRTPDLFGNTIAERRQRTNLNPVITLAKSTADREQHISVDSPYSMSTSRGRSAASEEDSVPGKYTSSSYCNSRKSSPVLPGSVHSANEQGVNGAIMDMYNVWTQNESPGLESGYSRRNESLDMPPRRSKSIAGVMNHSTIQSPPLPEVVHIVRHPMDSHRSSNGDMRSPEFSPLPLYFRGHGFPTTKTGEKTMIGRNGWLECTGQAISDDKRTKRVGFLESIKKIAREVTAELHPGSRRLQVTPVEVGATQVAISLDPREQSLLYCELDFHLACSLNDYITAEFARGHLVPDNLKKISDQWNEQGRPRVVGFRFDIETQLELISLHINEFSFYGRRQSNPSEISGLLHSMKINARAMRVRTFCHPDSVIAKQLVDSQSLFNLLNVSNAQQLALSEIAQFFKTIIQRETRFREQRDQSGRDSMLGGYSSSLKR